MGFGLNEMKEITRRERNYWYRFALQLLRTGPQADDIGTPWA